MRTVAKHLVDTLEKAGVKRIYGITGDSANYITEAIGKSEIRFVHTRHEESAAFAASAEASATGKLSACIGSCGPGSLHLVNGLYDANRNGAPVLAIATEIHRDQIGTRYVQEIDTQEVFRGCSKFCEYVRDAAQFPRLLGIAMQTAISEGGVAVLIITAEVSQQEMEHTEIKYLPFYPNPVIKPSPDEMETIVSRIDGARNVVIFGGAGCKGGEKAVKELSERIKAPIVWTYRAKEYLDYDCKYPLGMNGILGNSAAVYALYNADLILLLGCGFAFDTNYPDDVPIIQIDIRGDNLARRHNVELGFVGSIADTAEELLLLVEEKTDDEYALRCSEKYDRALKRLHKLTVQPDDSPHKIYPERLTAAINDKASHDAWIAADIGTPWAFLGRYIDSKGGRSFFTSSLHGTMAAALPYAIGLCATEPQRQVVVLCGDGGLAMLLGDLITLVQEGLQPKIFVYNNSSLDFVAMEMKADGLMPAFTDLVNPDFAAVSRSMGIKGIRVDKVAELDRAVDEALAYDGAVLVDVVVDPNSLLMPPQITAQMVGKFTTYAFKMVEHGEFEELLEEAVTNLRQL